MVFRTVIVGVCTRFFFHFHGILPYLKFFLFYRSIIHMISLGIVFVTVFFGGFLFFGGRFTARCRGKVNAIITANIDLEIFIFFVLKVITDALKVPP